MEVGCIFGCTVSFNKDEGSSGEEGLTGIGILQMGYSREYCDCRDCLNGALRSAPWLMWVYVPCVVWCGVGVKSQALPEGNCGRGICAL